MGKREVIVDTCFLEKMSTDGKNPENVKTILEELEYTPVAHPYMVEYEFSLCSYMQKMVDDGYIREIQYKEFLNDEYARLMYEQMFPIIHEDLRRALESSGGRKQIEKLQLKTADDIYNKHSQGSSIGNVHMIMMAAYMQLPIILTEDSDIEILRDIASRRMRLGQYKLEIYDGLDLVNQIAKNPCSTISKKKMEAILNQMGERKYRATMTKMWNGEKG